MASTDSKFRFAIDRGGTFTDVYCLCPGDKVRTMKLLSVDPANYKDAPTEAIRRILEQETGVTVPKNEPIDAANIEWIRMGTTVATNALLERKGERCALLITRGFKDLLHIGNQARPEIFDLEIKIPGPLYDRVIEVDERVVVNDDRCGLKENPASGWKEVTGENGEACFVTRSLNVSQLRKDLEELRRMGFNSLAVALMHSYVYRKHEDLVKRIAQDEMGFTSVSLSSEVMPMVKIVPRGYTACVDAYLTPLINRYVKDFLAGFTNITGTTLLFMQSDGGLTPVNNFSGSRAILSGPAGGVVGYAYTTETSSRGTGVIGFDMGGTSTDVSRYAGHLEHVFESVTGGVTIQAPQLDVVTVAAGGGSVLSFQSGLFYVGPESAGAHPGPACYRKNGPLAITDANLVLGRLLPQYFPCIFGPKENQPLDVEASRFKMTQVMNSVNDFKKVEALRDGKPFEPLTVEEVAMGFVRVANETMSRPIRNLTQARGFDARDHELACFGGAGAQHACAIARALGMSRVHVHKYAGILSAFGMALADVVQEAQEFCGRALDGQESLDYVNERMVGLRREAQTKLESQGFGGDAMHFTGFLHLRYKGTDYGIMCEIPSHTEMSVEGMTKIFETSYQHEFGFIMTERTIVIDDLRIRGTGNVFAVEDLPSESNSEDSTPPVDCITQVYFVGGYRDTKVHVMNALKPGHKIAGPAIIIDDLCTILIEPDCVGTVTSTGDLVIDVTIAGRTASKMKGLEVEVVDPIQLSIFSHRFMSIAEQMGRVLQRTAISTNIKERLDFSCALFGPDGGLVSNAPHIPVHLGSMQHAVQYQIEAGTVIEDGDVILSNHPSAGGTHLPDLTVITPVFRPGESKPVFYVASRGHHADIGGSLPGSMPPDSRTIFEEGASFKCFKIVSKGTFMEKELRGEFAKPGIEHADLGCSGARNITDNLADLKAQIAANRKGIALVNDLINYYGLDVVQSYMKHIRRNAELAVRDLIKAKAKTLQSVHVSMASMTSRGGSDDGAVIDRPVLLRAADWMDDGTKIKLCVSMSPKTGDAVFDFSGTGYQVWGNCNAPPAIAYSAIIYCLRCMVNRDIPLNQGCLNSVRVILPDGSILKPREDAAVVGGNVLTSQRLVDVIFKAFGACAASQGCMNNLTFGDETFGYYETIAGGAGAGPHWHGRSGVHTHMTNTRITDPEIFERRYPVVLEAFQLREGSGGKGRYRGGDGVVRRIRFRAKRGLDASLLTERRVFAPYGVLGGQNGAPGLNLLRRTNNAPGAGQEEEVLINLGSKSSLRLGPGDIIEIQTPGGGGWGGNYDVEEDEGCLLDDDVEIAASLRAESQHLVD